MNDEEAGLGIGILWLRYCPTRADELAPDLTAVDRFLASHRNALVQANVPISEIKLVNLLEGNGFRLADIEVSFRIEVAASLR